MAVALYDVQAGTLTRLGIGFGDINVSGTGNGQFATFRQSADALDLVPMISGRNYEIRFYGWGASTVFIDNPQLFAMYDSTVSVNNVTVNEGSPTAVFSVTARFGQNLSLALTPASALGTGTDYGSASTTNLQYSLNGGVSWINYTTAFNNTLTGTGITAGLLVRTPITNDTIEDNGETFTLTVTPTGRAAVVGTGTILDDGTGTIFTATGAVDNTAVKNDDRPATTVLINNLVVNEGSPTAVFTVTATVGQELALALANGTATGNGTDYGAGMEYSLDGGSTWIAYAGAFNNNLTGSGTSTGLLVRTPITNDTTPDNGETFTLTATPTGGTAVTGTATIKDDGSGTIFTATGAIDNAATKNNDITVNNLVVNEGSPTAVFTVTATVGQELALALANGTATGNGTDYGAGMEYSLDGGTTWIAYAGAFNNNLTGSGTSTGLLVRTPITNDTTPDNGETFTLTATPTGGTAVTGTATIKDDGSGTIFTATGAIDNAATKNNDITVNNLVVNEGSPTAVFTVTATVGQELALALANGTATGSGTDYGAGMEYSLDGGSTWVAYTGAFNNALTGTGVATGLLVRTPITNDSTPDNGETFTLTATPTGGTAVTGTATIKDDGSGTIFTATGAIDNAATKNNDITVNNLVVNEGSPTAVFTVTATLGQNLSLALANGTATGNGTDYGTGMEYSLDGGSTWIAYTGAFNNNLTGSGTSTGLLVRTPIINDAAYEMSETFTLTATATGGTGVTGTATIKDDGSGTIFTATGAVDSAAAKNDDRPTNTIFIDSIVVNEASPTAVFVVSAAVGQELALALANGTATGNGTDYGAGMEYSLDGGTTWIAYAGAFNNNLTGSGTSTGLLVRTPITNDTTPDNGETFTLTATPTGGTAVTGTATIKDDGSGTIFTATGAIDNAATKNNDITVNNLVVNEGSPTAVFTVTATVGQELALALANGTATGNGTDYGAGMEYSLDGGTTWIAYAGAFNNNLTGSGTSTGLLVRTPITNDTTPDNGETFTLTATPTGGTAVTGTATIKDDGSGTIFTATGAIDNAATKNNDITVNNLVVNEGSPTAVFTVTATLGQNLSLALANGTATGSGTDYGSGTATNLEYSLNGGATWTAYTGAFNNALTGTGVTTGLLVRTPITNDSTPDNNETFTLTATPTGGTAVTGTATIKDDGSGTIFTATGAIDNAAVKNNDITVNSITVNEASSTAVFTVTATIGQNLSLALANGTATGNGTDYGTGMEYSLDGGSNWVTYTGAFNNALTGSGTSTGLLVRTPITNDTTPDNGETFTLAVTPTGGTSVTGTATIKDDGTGEIFGATGAIINTPFKNNDITVSSITVNEASPTAVFTVTATLGQNLSLALANGTATGSGTDYGAGMEYSLDGGSTWVAYTGAFNNALTGTGVATGLLVRTPITNDSTPDNGETFTLTATPTGGTAVTGTATIKDDGSGTIFTATGAIDNAAVKNNDITVNNLVVNEGSPTAVFTVTATVGQELALALANGTATGSGTDYGSGIQYSLDGGATWINYTTAFNNNLTGTGVTTGLLVRTPIINDAAYEMSETFTLTATPTGGTAVTGTATIKDDGSGTIFTATGAIDNAAVKDDDRPVNPAFVNNILVNEASSCVVFTITGVRSAQITLSLAAGTATSNVDYTNSIDYWNGSAWTAYSAANPPSLDNADGALKVRVPILQDTVLDGGENFQLTVRYTGVKDPAVTNLYPDTTRAFIGNAIIVDDATGQMWNSAGIPITPVSTATIDIVANPGLVIADDDRPLTVSNATVNEASPYAVFTITGAANQYVKLSLANGSATSADYNPAFEYFDGTAWVNYIPGSYVQMPAGGTTLLVRVAILDDAPYEGAETFTLTASNTGGGSNSGTGTIKDDGTGLLLNANGNPITPVTTAVIDLIAFPDSVVANDDRPLTVSDIAVNEASPYAVFTVTGAANQYVMLLMEDETATDADYGPALEYYNGTSWVSYIPGSFVQIPATGTTLLVRTTIVNDTPFEGSETFSLSAFNTSRAGALGTCTIKDDGTGSLFSGVNTTGLPESPRSNGLPARLNNDRSPSNLGSSLPPPAPTPDPPAELPPTILTGTRIIPPPPFIAKPIERPPVQMGKYEFNSVVLDFNGVHGGINQFGLPHVDSTASRGALSYSNATPYAFYDRVTDEVDNAQRTIKLNLALSPEGDSKLRNPVLPPDVKLDSENRATYTLPAGTFVGGMGVIKLAAFTKDGKPLPEWIKFNPVKGNFDITMPKGRSEPIEIQVIATDAKGDQAKTKLTIKPPINKLDKAIFIGKPSLVSQIKSAVMLGKG
jgi:hypothetical protein